MATAEFPATYVYEKAVERACALEAKRLAHRDQCVATIMQSPDVSGRLWWKKIQYLTEGQAAERYDRSADHYHGVWWWSERRFHKAVELVAPLQRIASAIIQTGHDGLITLTPDDCAALDIPFGFEVVK